ncbi:hypothetical protein J1614_012192 [Plenodomus biglobosus]|nr:hypothetical protein J1614_012192 [Plenodomus biglobosus]
MSPRPPSPPLPWAFAPYYARPLPPQLNFDPVTGFGNMVDAMEILGVHDNPPGTVRVNAAVATYKDGKQKQAWVSGVSQQGHASGLEARIDPLSRAEGVDVGGIGGRGGLGLDRRIAPVRYRPLRTAGMRRTAPHVRIWQICS